MTFYFCLAAQELKKVKEAIQSNNEELLKTLVETNPRYLMTPCDQPSIIHSGTRANALHIAAANGNVAMAELILEMISSLELVERMYPNESPEKLVQRQEYLLDLYLNMPKKGDFDTPLHQAAKWGHWQVIELLVQYSSCNTAMKNKEGKTPFEVACTRTGSVDQDIKKKIQNLLQDRVYIPVFRIQDHSVPGFIGDPLSPSDPKIETIKPISASPSISKTSSSSSSPFMSPKRALLSPFHSRASMNTFGDSPMIVVKNVNSNLPFMDNQQSPVTSPMTIRALMGPLSPIDADKIKQEWKKSSSSKQKGAYQIRLSDPDKGLERQGRDLAKKFGTQMVEYWPFLDTYCDITSDDGLQILENHLLQQYDHVRGAEEEDKYHTDFMDELESNMANLNLNVSQNMSTSSAENNENNGDDLNGNPGSDGGLLDLLSSSNQSQEEQSTIHDNIIWHKNNDNNCTENTFKKETLTHFERWNQPRETTTSTNNCLNSNDSMIDDQFHEKSSLSNSSSCSSFVSAMSSLDESIYSAEDFGSWIYIEGPNRPTKTDLQVYEALSDCAINPSKYPRIHTWKCSIESSTDQERKQWKKNRHFNNKKPIIKFSFMDDSVVTN